MPLVTNQDDTPGIVVRFNDEPIRQSFKINLRKMLAGLVEINEMGGTHPLTNIVSDEDLVRASNNGFALVEQFKPLDSVIEISAADKVREVIQLPPAEVVDDLVEFPMFRRQRQVKSVASPLDLDEKREPKVFHLDSAPPIPPSQSSG